MYPPILRVDLKDQQRTYVMMLMQCFAYFLLLIFFIKAHVTGNYLNCVDKLMQFNWVPICLYKEVDKKYTGCNLKTTELLD